ENRRFERKNEDRPGSSHEPRSVNIRKTQCYRCNGSHNHRGCKFRFEYCLKCGKRGHIAKACKGTNQNKVTTVGQVKPPLFRTLNLNGKDVKFQVDTGATRTIIPPSVYKRHKNLKIKSFNEKLQSASGHEIPVLGEATFTLKTGNREIQVTGICVKSKSSDPLLGR